MFGRAGRARSHPEIRTDKQQLQVGRSNHVVVVATAAFGPLPPPSQLLRSPLTPALDRPPVPEGELGFSILPPS